MDHSNPEGFLITFHYPNQLLSPSHLPSSDWKPRSSITHPYSMMFRIKAMTSIKSRRKSGSNCIENQVNYDQFITDLIIQKVGCLPPYWDTKLNIGRCINSSYAHFTYDHLLKEATSNSPCHFINQIDFSYQDDDSPDISTAFFNILLFNWISETKSEILYFISRKFFLQTLYTIIRYFHYFYFSSNPKQFIWTCNTVCDERISWNCSRKSLHFYYFGWECWWLHGIVFRICYIALPKTFVKHRGVNQKMVSNKTINVVIMENTDWWKMQLWYKPLQKALNVNVSKSQEMK